MSKFPTHVQATRYTVSVLPPTHRDRRHFEITVEYRGSDLWAVCYAGECLNDKDTWDYEMLPSDRTDEWITEHRFFLGEAITRAKKMAPSIEVNGATAGMILRRDERNAQD